MQENIFDKFVFFLTALMILSGILLHIAEGVKIFRILEEIEEQNINLKKRFKIFTIWSMIFTLISCWLLISLYYYMKPF